MKKYKKLLIFSIVIVSFLLVNIVYAVYINSVEVNYESQTGKMICNMELDKNENYVVNGVPYAIVKVKNYNEDENGEKTVTAVDVEYSLSIKNQEGSNGTYIWQKVDEEDSSKYSEGTNLYLESVTTSTFSFNKKNPEEDVYKIFFKSTNSENTENIKFDVVLNSVQKVLDNQR